jgi:hypothetical protein
MYILFHSGSTEIRQNVGKTKLTFSQDIECEIVRSNVSPFNKNILLLGVSKRKHVTGERRKLLHNLYSSQGHVARMGQGRKVYKVLVGKPEGKRPFGRPRRRRENGKRMAVRETGGGVNRIRLARDKHRRQAIVIFLWSINIDVSMDTHRYISIGQYRYISIY